MARKYLSVHLIRRIRETAGNRCGYCLAHQNYVLHPITIEHIIPLVEGGTDDEDNLWLSCGICNGHKSDKVTAIDPETGERVALFNPRTQHWKEHFRWSEDGIYVIGLTPIGRATVEALHLSSNEIAIRVRRMWISAGWHPPKD